MVTCVFQQPETVWIHSLRLAFTSVEHLGIKVMPSSWSPVTSSSGLPTQVCAFSIAQLKAATKHEGPQPENKSARCILTMVAFALTLTSTMRVLSIAG
eukprot:3166301-Amphidinium_carterae.1